MQAILIKLKGPMVSWGTPAIGDNRDTYELPTASAILGFLGACLGIDKRDKEQLDMLYHAWNIASFTRSNSSHVQSSIAYDFQTATDSLLLNGDLNKSPVIGFKGFLQESVTSAALIWRGESSEDVLTAVCECIKRPVFIPYLGRLSQPFSEFPEPEIIAFDCAEQLTDKLIGKVTQDDALVSGKLLIPVQLFDAPVDDARIEQLSDRRQGWRKYYGRNDYWLKEISYG